MTDEIEIELLRGLRPRTTGPDPALVARERKALMAIIATETPQQVQPRSGRGHSHRRSRWLVPVVALVSTTTAAAGWALLRADPRTSTAVACGDSVVDSQTGDPVADCQALWRREKGGEAPPMVAYVGPGGGVHVLPSEEEVPNGFAPLAPSFRQEAALIELEAELSDVGRGLRSACFVEPDARRIVEVQLGRLGLVDWTVTARRPQGPSPENCPANDVVYPVAIVHPEKKQVELLANVGGPPPQDLAFMTLGRRLNESLVDGPDARCLTVEQAAALARQEAARLGMLETNGQVSVTTIPAADPTTPTCARPTTVVGGSVNVTIRAVAR